MSWQNPGLPTSSTSGLASETTLTAVAGFLTEPYDYMDVTSINAAGDPLIIVYKSGGAAGTTVRTLTLTYDANGNVDTVTAT